MELEGEVALVTGASRGLGYHCALALAKAGAHVVALARTVGGLEELDEEIRAAGGSATLVPLDLTDFDGLDRLTPALAERWGRLDVLFGNAGHLAPLTPLGHLSDEQWQRSFDVNVTANFRLLRSLDPLLREAPRGTALFVTSGAARNNRAYVGPYSIAKAALEALARTYAAENRQTGVTANLIEPGTLRTRMRAQYAPGEDPLTVTPPEDLAALMPAIVAQARERSGETYDFPNRRWREPAGAA